MCDRSAAASTRLRLAIAIALAAPAVPFGASATTTGLEEVIVTAQRREESLQDTPVFVTPLQQDDLENRVIRSTTDLIGNVAGVSGMSNPGTRSATSLTIRGLSAGSAANLSSDPAVGVYVDGVYIGKMLGSGMESAEIERMEIMRGPQGSLYGRNATAGAMTITSHRPSGEAGLRTTVSYGNHNSLELKLYGDTPSVGEVGEGLGRLSATAGFQMRQRDGLVENEGTGPDYDDIDRSSWRIGLAWEPVDSVRVDYSYDESRLDEVGAVQDVIGFTAVDPVNTDRLAFLRTRVLGTASYFATIPGADPRIASRWIPSINATIAAYEGALADGRGFPDSGVTDFVPRSDDSADGHTLNVAWEAGELGALGDVTFKSITGARSFETHVTGDLENIDSTLVNGIGAYNDLVHLTLLQIYGGTVAAGFPPVASPAVSNLWSFIDRQGANHSYQDALSEFDQFSQEVQMVGSTEQLDYIVGAQYFEDDGEYHRNSYFSSPLTGRRPENYEVGTESWAYYAQGSYRFAALADRLALAAGLRYTEEKKDVHYMYGAGLTPFGAVPAQDLYEDKNFHNLSYDGTLTWHFTGDFNTFVRFANAYRSGGYNGEVFDNPYDEETVDQWEVGLKSHWLDQRLRVYASVYQYTGEDLQTGMIRVVNGKATSGVVNAGEVERWGADVEVAAAPIDDLVLGLTWSFIDGDYEKFPPTCPSNPANCLDTDDLAERPAPANQLSASADWTFARTGLGDLDLYLQVHWQDESRQVAITTGVMGTAPNDVVYVYDTPELDARTLVGARLGWSNIPVGNNSLKLTLWARNLLDEEYPSFGINFGALGLLTQQYGEPRMYGLEASYEF